MRMDLILYQSFFIVRAFQRQSTNAQNRCEWFRTVRNECLLISITYFLLGCQMPDLSVSSRRCRSFQRNCLRSLAYHYLHIYCIIACIFRPMGPPFPFCLFPVWFNSIMFSRLTVVTLFVLSASAAPAILARQATTRLSSSQISAFKPYTYFASAAFCLPSTTLPWNCGGMWMIWCNIAPENYNTPHTQPTATRTQASKQLRRVEMAIRHNIGM